MATASKTSTDKYAADLKKARYTLIALGICLQKSLYQMAAAKWNLQTFCGHESLETTRIYTTKSIAEQRETLNNMQRNKSKVFNY